MFLTSPSLRDKRYDVHRDLTILSDLWVTPVPPMVDRDAYPNHMVAPIPPVYQPYQTVLMI